MNDRKQILELPGGRVVRLAAGVPVGDTVRVEGDDYRVRWDGTCHLLGPARPPLELDEGDDDA